MILDRPRSWMLWYTTSVCATLLSLFPSAQSNSGRLQDQDPYFRAVVFSQFTSFLSLISVALDREHLSWYRFDGSMDIKKRNAAISEFKQNERKPKVLIVSLKAGGVGLNVSASYVSLELSY